MQRKLRDLWGNDPGEKHIQVRYTPLNFNLLKLNFSLKLTLIEAKLLRILIFRMVNDAIQV